MKIHCFQHVAFENLGAIALWAEMHGHSITYTRFYNHTIDLPELTSFDFLIVLGGYMNVDDEKQFHWLHDEKVFIKNAILAQKKVLGICLGSQLIAAALGSKITQNKETEIGFLPINFTSEILSNSLFNHFKNPYTVFQWHGDTFELPKNAIAIANSEACENQGFYFGTNVLAFQFHIEMTPDILLNMLMHDGHELLENRQFIQSKNEIISKIPILKSNSQDLFELLTKFTSI